MILGIAWWRWLILLVVDYLVVVGILQLILRAIIGSRRKRRKS